MIYAEYKLNDGRIIRVYLNDALEMSDKSDKNFVKEYVTACVYDKKKRECSKSIDCDVIRDETGTYFMFETEKVYVNNFLYYTLEEMNEKLENGEYVNEEELLATLQKEKDRIVLYEKLQIPDMVFMGIRCYSNAQKDNTTYVLCEIIEDNFYNRYKWCYKIMTAPIEPEERYIFGSERHSMSSFVGDVVRGDILLKDRKDFGLEYNKEKEMELKKLL